ncbi:hypothetical protein LINPERHAP1_LOCUS31742, partial [Linum perenne]
SGRLDSSQELTAYVPRIRDQSPRSSIWFGLQSIYTLVLGLKKFDFREEIYDVSPQLPAH